MCKYKIKLTETAMEQLASMSEEQKQEIFEAFEQLALDPYEFGKPIPDYDCTYDEYVADLKAQGKTYEDLTEKEIEKLDLK